jgi:hypothetical protein
MASLSEFFAPLFIAEHEEINFRAFKAKGAPDSADRQRKLVLNRPRCSLGKKGSSLIASGSRSGCVMVGRGLERPDVIQK